MNKKLLLLISAFALLIPGIALATPSSVNRLINHIEPLINTDSIRAPFFTATSTTAISTFAGIVGIGSTSPFANLTVQDNPGSPITNAIFTVASSSGQNAFTVYPGGYIQAGPLVSRDTAYCTYGKYCLGYFGSDNTLSGVNIEVGNYSSGTSAYGGLTVLNDLDDPTGSHYFFFGLTSSNYNDPTFGTSQAVPNQGQIVNSDGQLLLQANFNGTTTVPTANNIIFTINGTSIANEIARLTPVGLAIGTTTPTSKLTVSASDAGTTLTSVSAAMTSIINTNTTDGNFSDLAFGTADASGGTAITSKIVGINTVHTGSATSGDIAFLTRSAGTITEKMRILANGNVGIGTTTPGAKLQITGTAGSGDIFAISSSSNTQLLTVKSTGNVGIGTTTPGALLTVAGNIQFGSNTISNAGTGGLSIDTTGRSSFTGASAANLAVLTLINTTGTANSGTTLQFQSGAGVTGALIGTVVPISSTNVDLTFSTRGSAVATEKMRILANGNVGIGSTTPGSKFVLHDQSGTAGTTTLFAIASSTPTGTATTTLFVVRGNGSVGIGTSTPSGTALSTNGTNFMANLTASAGLQTGILCLSAQNEVINESVACVASAKRYKENIQDLGPGLSELMQLRPVSFTWKKDYLGRNVNDPNQNGIQYSLIADEVQKVDPNLVSLTTGTSTFEGITYGPGSINGLADMNHWVALLVSSIQQVVKRQDNTDTRIDALEARITILEAENKKISHMCVMP